MTRLNEMAKHWPDVALVSGAASVSVGAGLIYAPAGFIVAGLLLLVAGYVGSRA